MIILDIEAKKRVQALVDVALRARGIDAFRVATDVLGELVDKDAYDAAMSQQIQESLKQPLTATLKEPPLVVMETGGSQPPGDGEAPPKE